MAHPPQPWTEQDEQQRRRLLEMADARGLTHSEMARRIGASQPTFHRWTKGRTHLSLEQLEQLEGILEGTAPGIGADLEDENAPLTAEAMATVRAELTALVPQPPADEADPLGWVCREQAVLIAASALKLAVSAKSEGIRLGACKFLADRGWGKAVQRIAAENPEAPVEAGTLLDKLLQIEERLQGEE